MVKKLENEYEGMNSALEKKYGKAVRGYTSPPLGKPAQVIVYIFCGLFCI